MTDDRPERLIANARARQAWTDEQLEQALQRRADEKDGELVVEQLDNGEWRAAIVQTDEHLPTIGPAVLASAESPERRRALDDLLSLFDITDSLT